MDEAIQVRWPRKMGKTKLQIKLNADKILNGTVLAIDPSSGSKESQPGYAIFKAGVLQDHGTLKIPHKVIYERMPILYDKIQEILPIPLDVFLIEQIRGQNFSHVFLNWACGVSISAVRAPVTIEIEVLMWRAYMKCFPEYVKSDATDAVMIAEAVLFMANQFKNKTFDESNI
jgi:hypothetical protein